MGKKQTAKKPASPKSTAQPRGEGPSTVQPPATTGEQMLPASAVAELLRLANPSVDWGTAIAALGMTTKPPTVTAPTKTSDQAPKDPEPIHQAEPPHSKPSSPEITEDRAEEEEIVPETEERVEGRGVEKSGGNEGEAAETVEEAREVEIEEEGEKGEDKKEEDPTDPEGRGGMTNEEFEEVLKDASAKRRLMTDEEFEELLKGVQEEEKEDVGMAEGRYQEEVEEKSPSVDRGNQPEENEEEVVPEGRPSVKRKLVMKDDKKKGERASKRILGRGKSKGKGPGKAEDPVEISSGEDRTPQKKKKKSRARPTGQEEGEPTKPVGESETEATEADAPVEAEDIPSPTPTGQEEHESIKPWRSRNHLSPSQWVRLMSKAHLPSLLTKKRSPYRIPNKSDWRKKGTSKKGRGKAKDWPRRKEARRSRE